MEISFRIGRLPEKPDINSNMEDELKIYICTHTDFEPVVHNPVYEILDARNINGDMTDDGLPGSYYSELMTYRYAARYMQLPEYVGFCGYRKYFKFMDNVPVQLLKSFIGRYGCLYGTSLTV